MEQLGNQVAFHADLPELYDISGQSSQFDQSKMIQFSSDLFLLKSGATSSIVDIFVYFKNSGTVVGPGRKAQEKMYYSLISGYQEVSYETWGDFLTQGPYQKEILPSMTLSRNNREVLTYIQSLPYACGKESMGELVIQMDAQAIREKLDSIEQMYGGQVYIFDSQDRLMIGPDGCDESQMQEIRRNSLEHGPYQFYQNQEKMMATGIAAENGWEYLLVMPYGTFMEEAYRTRNSVTAIVICFFTAAVVLSVFLAYRNYQPLKKILRMVSKDAGRDRQNEYEMIYRTILDYRSHEEDLNAIISGQEKTVRANYLSRVLHGFAADFDEESLRPIGIHFSQDSFYAALLRVEDITRFSAYSTEREWALIRFILANVAEDLLNSCGHVYPIEISREQLALLINYGDSSPETLRELKDCLQELIDIMREQLRIDITASMSSAHSRPEEICLCYHEAQKALDSRFMQGKGGLILYSELIEDCTHFYYPLEEELQICNLVKAGDYRNLKPLLDKIFDENLQKRSLSLEMGKCLCVNIISTILKLSDSLCIPFHLIDPEHPDPFAVLEESASLTEIQQQIMRCFENFCAHIKGLQNSPGERTVSQVKRLVDAHCGDPLLGLHLLADQMNLTPQYLSGLFKKQTGENLSDYITRVRIERACLLLRESQLTIGEVAVQVGYATSATLIKLFKRYIGITLGKYREQWQKGSEK